MTALPTIDSHKGGLEPTVVMIISFFFNSYSLKPVAFSFEIKIESLFIFFILLPLESEILITLIPTLVYFEELKAYPFL